MIVGHLGVAAALAAARPRTDLRWLLPAAIAPDLLDVAYALSGICNPYGLFSHSLPAAALLGAVFGGCALLARDRGTGLLVSLVVLLHLPMDFVTGNKLFWPGGEMHGLLLYHRPALDFLVEVAIAACGWWLLRRRAAAPRWATSALALLAMILVQAAFDAIDAPGGVKPTACVAMAAPL